MNTVTRAHLAEMIYMQVGLSRNESADLLEIVLEKISSALQTGESVKISGFGTFSVRQKGRRVGRNPKTGEEVPILPRRVLVFRPSHVLKARANGQTPSQTNDSDEEDLDWESSDQIDPNEDGADNDRAAESGRGRVAGARKNRG